MGARGPLKIPSHLRPVTDGELAGSAAEATPSEAPVKPQVVADDQALSGYWDQIVPELDRVGLVSPADGPTVTLMLMHVATAIKAYEQVGDSVVAKDHHNGDVKKNPAEAVFRAESDMALRYFEKLGMTWMSRARTPAAKGREDGDANPFQGAAVG